MHHIPTPPAAVSKLKKAAKLLVRRHGNLPHAEALDRVASTCGYANWKHVTICAAATDALPPASPGIPDPRVQSLTFLVGRSGSGKTHMAKQMATSRLDHTTPVHIMDFGRSYRELCHSEGGTFVTLTPDGCRRDVLFGPAPLWLFDFGNHELVFSPAATPYLSLLRIPEGQITPVSLLIIDEHPYVANLLGGSRKLASFVSDYMKAGGSAVVITQEPLCDAEMRLHLPDTLVGRVTPTLLTPLRF